MRLAALTVLVLGLVLPITITLAQTNATAGTTIIVPTLTLPVLPLNGTVTVPALPALSNASVPLTALPPIVNNGTATATVDPSSVLPALSLPALVPNASGTSGSTIILPSTLPSGYTLLGTFVYPGQYQSRLSLMSASANNLWRVELMIPQSASMVELHFVIQQGVDGPLMKPQALQAQSGTVSQSTSYALLSAVYSPITDAFGLSQWIASSDPALAYSLQHGTNSSLLSSMLATGGSASANNVQLNWLMSEVNDRHWSLDYLVFNPLLNQTLYHYYTIHNDKGGQDTPWQRVTPDDGGRLLPNTSYTADNSLVDTSQSSLIFEEAGFQWQPSIVKVENTVSNNFPPGPPGSQQQPTMPANTYEIVFNTNRSQALLWVNVDYTVNDKLSMASMKQVSATQWTKTLTLNPNDVLFYNFSWWSMIDNQQHISQRWFIYRPVNNDPSVLQAAVSKGTGTPSGYVAGSGQSLWDAISQEVTKNVALAITPTVPGLTSLPPSPFGTSSPLSSAGQSSSSVGSTVSNGLSSLSDALLGGLSRFDTGDVTIVNDATNNATNTNTDANTSGVSVQALSDVLTPFSVLLQLSQVAGITDSVPTNPSSMSGYVSSALCVIPCTQHSDDFNAMSYCMGSCMQPYLPAGVTASQASGMINDIHQWIVQQMPQSTPVAVNSTVVDVSDPNAASVNSAVSGSTGSAATNATTIPSSPAAPTDGAPTATTVTAPTATAPTVPATTATSAPTTGSIPAVPSTTGIAAQAPVTGSAAATPSNTAASTSMPSPSGTPSAPPAPGSAPLNGQAADRIAQWLTQPAARTTGPLTSTNLGSTVVGGLSSLSGALTSGLSTLSTGDVTVSSIPLVSSLPSSLTSLPITALSWLLSPIVPPSTSSQITSTASTYISSMVCLTPCVTEASVLGVSGTSSCIGQCSSALLPGTSVTQTSALVNSIDSWVRSTVLPAPPTPATGTAAAAPSSTGSALSTPPAAVNVNSSAPVVSLPANNTETAAAASTGSAPSVPATQPPANPAMDSTPASNSTVVTATTSPSPVTAPPVSETAPASTTVPTGSATATGPASQVNAPTVNSQPLAGPDSQPAATTAPTSATGLASPSAAVPVAADVASAMSISAANTDGITTQAVFDVIDPSALASVASLASLLSAGSLASASSVGDFSAYVNSAVCAMPCASNSETFNTMSYCIGNCVQPFLPSGITASQGAAAINGVHDWLITQMGSAASVVSSMPAPSVAMPAVTAPRVAGNLTAIGNATIAAATGATVQPLAATSNTTAAPALSTLSTLPQLTTALPVLDSAAASSLANWLKNTGTTSDKTFSEALGSTTLAALVDGFTQSLKAVINNNTNANTGTGTNTVSVSDVSTAVPLSLPSLSLSQPVMNQFVGSVLCLASCMSAADSGVDANSACVSSCSQSMPGANAIGTNKIIESVGAGVKTIQQQVQSNGLVTAASSEVATPLNATNAVDGADVSVQILN